MKTIQIPIENDPTQVAEYLKNALENVKEMLSDVKYYVRRDMLESKDIDEIS